MTTQIKLGNIAVDVVFKDIKNVHLSVYPPSGRVRISAPSRMSIDTVRVYVISKIDWIKRQQRKLISQERETRREYIDRESHYVWGQRALLKVLEKEVAPEVELKHRNIILTVRPESSERKKKVILNEWYRQQMKEAIPPLIAKWEPVVGVKVGEWGVKKMKTKWGACNTKVGRIWLNLELAKKPEECLEYVLVHEMIHLIERKHGDRFKQLMEQYLPNWKHTMGVLNSFPLRHEDWKY